MGWAMAGLLIVVVLSAALAVLLARRRFVVVEVSGVSMLPTYRPGDRVLVRRTRVSNLRRDQVVVLESQHRGRWRTGPLPGPKAADWLIKRIAAVPGDTVSVACAGAEIGDIVPPGKLIMLGDGERSADSRHWGYAPADRVLGAVVRQLGAGASSAS